MRVGVPKEIKSNENRVGLVPSSVRALFAAAPALTRAVDPIGLAQTRQGKPPGCEAG